MKKNIVIMLFTLITGVLASQAHAISCAGIPTWNAADVYTQGMKAQKDGKAYTANWWTQGADPVTHSGQWQEWTLNGTCDGVTSSVPSSSKASSSSVVVSSVKSSVSSSSSSSVITTGCTSPVYVAGTAYTAGQLVQNGGNEYRCDIAGWCSSTAAWAYAPGTGTAWTQAWTLVRSCSAVSSSSVVASSKASSSSSSVVSSVSSVGPAPKFVYSAYKDVTVNANWNTNGMQGFNTSGSLLPIAQAMPAKMKTLTWAFVTGECGSGSPTPVGENVAGMDPVAFAATNVASFVNSGKTYIVAVGGAAGAFTCGSDAGFTTFLNHFNSANLVGIDFDIEGGRLNASQIAALVARVKTAQQSHPNLRFSFTIPTLATSKAGSSVAVDMGSSSPDPLADDGHMVMNAIKAAGLQNYTINLMTMDYGPASPAVCVVSGGGCQQGQSAIQAAMDLHNFYNLPYSQIEITPEIPADDQGSPFSTGADISAVTTFVKNNGLAGLHYWAYERDTNGLPYATGFANGLGL